MDRYTVLKTGTQKEWLAGCPVRVDKYNILLDNQTNKNVLQIKYIVLFNKAVKSMWASIVCYDDAGDSLLTINDVVYANVKASAKTSFGNNQPIEVNSNLVGSIKIAVQKIVFTDETVWRNDENKIGIILPEQASVKAVYGELFNQFYIEAKKANVPCQKGFVKADTYWQCTCGQANTANAENCCMCGTKFETLAKISDKNYLSKQNNLRIEQEKAEAERVAKVKAENERLAAEKAEKERIEKKKRDAEEKLRREKAAANKKRLCIIIAVLIVISIIGYAVVKNIQKANKYKAAEDFLANKNYQSAAELFIELGDYKDSADKVKDINYRYANELYNKGEYEQARSYYSELGDYNNSIEMEQACTNQMNYKIAIVSYNNAYYISVAEMFQKLGSFANSAEMFENSKYMLYTTGVTYMNRGPALYKTAVPYFEALAAYNYKDSRQKLEWLEQHIQ